MVHLSPLKLNRVYTQSGLRNVSPETRGANQGDCSLSMGMEPLVYGVSSSLDPPLGSLTTLSFNQTTKKMLTNSMRTARKSRDTTKKGYSATEN